MKRLEHFSCNQDKAWLNPFARLVTGQGDAIEDLVKVGEGLVAMAGEADVGTQAALKRFHEKARESDEADWVDLCADLVEAEAVEQSSPRPRSQKAKLLKRLDLLSGELRKRAD